MVAMVGRPVAPPPGEFRAVEGGAPGAVATVEEEARAAAARTGPRCARSVPFGIEVLRGLDVRRLRLERSVLRRAGLQPVQSVPGGLHAQRLGRFNVLHQRSISVARLRVRNQRPVCTLFGRFVARHGRHLLLSVRLTAEADGLEPASGDGLIPGRRRHAVARPARGGDRDSSCSLSSRSPDRRRRPSSRSRPDRARCSRSICRGRTARPAGPRRSRPAGHPRDLHRRNFEARDVSYVARAPLAELELDQGPRFTR